MEDVLRNQLDEKERTCEHLEMEVADLRNKNQKTDASIKFKSSTAILDEILDCQRSPFEKSWARLQQGSQKL